MGPRKIGGKLDGTTIIVAIGGSDTHCLDGIDTTHLLDDDLQSFYTSVYIIFNLIITTRLNGGCGLDVATGINDSEY